MKRLKLLSIIGIMFLLSMTAGTVFAGLNEDISCTVLIQALSVHVDSSSYAFGALATSGSSEPTTQTITVTNNGNVTETYELSLAYAGAWTSTTGDPGNETFRMSAVFSANANDAGNYDGAVDALTTTPELCIANKFAIDGGSVADRGYSVATSAARSLNFRFEAPTVTTETAQQYITVTITATAS